MANIETLGDGVTVYVASMPEIFQKTIQRVTEKDPSLTSEETLVVAIWELSALAEIALDGIEPESVVA